VPAAAGNAEDSIVDPSRLCRQEKIQRADAGFIRAAVSDGTFMEAQSPMRSPRVDSSSNAGL